MLKRIYVVFFKWKIIRCCGVDHLAIKKTIFVGSRYKLIIMSYAWIMNNYNITQTIFKAK